MKLVISVIVFVSAIAFSILARPHSLGMKLQQSAKNYADCLAAGDAIEAKQFMTQVFSNELSAEFLQSLSDVVVPSTFVYDGIDSRGYRMVGAAGETGTRVIWFTVDNDVKVTADTAIDNILGMAVMLCTEEARLNPEGSCPVSGAPYQFIELSNLVVCSNGHLGEGLSINSNECAEYREEVREELERYLEAGFEYPQSLEEMFDLSGQVYGNRGGYSCPENGYKYYDLQNGEIYCPFHQNLPQEETSAE